MNRSITVSPSLSFDLLKILPAISFILILLAGAFSGLRSLPKGTELSSETLIKGKWAAQFEADFNENIAFRQTAIDTWGLLEYGLFKNGREGVIIGQDPWLFTSEEFEYYPDERVETQIKLDYMQEVQTKLAEQGISLVVALIPAKARVYEEKLGRYSLPDYTEHRYEMFRQALLAKGIHAPDLLKPLLAAKATAPVFLSSDTHWTPFGAQVASDALLTAIAPLKRGEFATNEVGTQEHKGDLLSFIPLGAFEHLGPHPDQLKQYETTGEQASMGLFGDVSIPVSLVGTSYSANPLWNFEGALKTSLQADVLNAAQEGKGPIIPMMDYLSDESFKTNAPEVIIWEFPERFIPVPYDLERANNESQLF